MLAIQKPLSVSIALLFFSQVAFCSLAESNVWEGRRKSRLQHKREKSPAQLASISSFGPSSLLNPADVINKLPSINSALPERPQRKKEGIGHPLSWNLQKLVGTISSAHGTVKDVYDSGIKENPKVVIIQDVHLNAEAQRHIVGLLQELIDQKEVDVIGVEGAFGPIDFKPFRDFPDRVVARRVIEALLNNKILAAPSAVGIFSETDSPYFLGVDDRTHYQADVGAYLTSRRTQERASGQLLKLTQLLHQAKHKVFSPALKEFDDLRTAYRDGSLGFGHFVSRLGSYAIESSFVVDRFLAAYEMESTLDFKAVERERRKVIQALTTSLSEKELKNLLARSLAYRMGRLGFGDYYRGIRDLCESQGYDLRQTPNFDNYIRYVLLSDGINAGKLFDDVEASEARILASLIRTPAEKTLADLSTQLMLIKKLVDFSLTSREWERYRKGERYLNSIHAALLRLLGDEREENKYFISLANYEAFYQEAEIRSRKMVKNLLSGSKGETRVLVTGGFHTSEVAELLRAKKLSYLVVAPKITKVEDEAGSSYLSVFSMAKTPLDQLFSGEKLFINPRSVNVQYRWTGIRTLASLNARIAAGFKEHAKKIKVQFDYKGPVELLVKPASNPANDAFEATTLYRLKTWWAQNLSAQPASILNGWAKKRWGATSWRYSLYTIFGASWEVVFQLLIPGAMIYFGPSLEAGVLTLVVSSVLFSLAHPNGRKRKLKFPQPSRQKERIALGSAINSTIAKRWRENSWAYAIYTVLGVNWEVAFQLIVPMSMAVLGPGLPVGIPALLLSATLFAASHSDQTVGRMTNLFAVGLLLGIPFVMPGLPLLDQIIISMATHSSYNFLVLLNPFPWALSLASKKDVRRPRDKGDRTQQVKALETDFAKAVKQLKEKGSKSIPDFHIKYAELIRQTLQKILNLHGINDQLTLVAPQGSLARGAPPYGTDIDLFMISNPGNRLPRNALEAFIDDIETILKIGFDMPARIWAPMRPAYYPTLEQLHKDLAQLDGLGLRSLLDMRFLAGNRELYSEFAKLLQRDLTTSLQKWLWSHQTIEDDDELNVWLEQGDYGAGDAHSPVERDNYVVDSMMKMNQDGSLNIDEFRVKSGPSGLRTIQLIVYLGRIIKGIGVWDWENQDFNALLKELKKQTFLDKAEEKNLEEARDFYLKMRSAVNLAWEKKLKNKKDKTALIKNKHIFRREIQGEVAQLMGSSVEALIAKIRESHYAVREVLGRILDEHTEFIDEAKRTDDSRPMNLVNSGWAFGTFLGLWALSISNGVPGLSLMGTPALVLTLYFGGLFALNSFFAWLNTVGKSKMPTGPPHPISLYGHTASPNENTDFIEYNPAKNRFDLNPTLFKLLNSRFRLLGHLILWSSLAPLHERLHARGVPGGWGEGVAYGVGNTLPISLVTVGILFDPIFVKGLIGFSFVVLIIYVFQKLRGLRWISTHRVGSEVNPASPSTIEGQSNSKGFPPPIRTSEEILSLYDRYLNNEVAPNVSLRDLFSLREIRDTLLEHYMNEIGLARFTELRRILKADIDILEILLDDPALRPIFLQVLPPAALEEKPDIVDPELVGELGIESTIQRYGVFLPGTPALANQIAQEGGDIIIAVTDRTSDPSESLHQYEQANRRQAYIPLKDGTWLGIKGVGLLNSLLKDPFVGDQGRVTAAEAFTAKIFRPELKQGGLDFSQTLAVWKLKKLPNGKGKTNQVVESDWRQPYLIFSRVLQPHRLTKLPQLLKSDTRLVRLRRRISKTLGNIGVIPKGKILSNHDFFSRMMRSMGRVEAIKNNKRIFKDSLQSQDVILGGGEADNTEWRDLKYQKSIIDGTRGLLGEDDYPFVLTDDVSILHLLYKIEIISLMISHPRSLQQSHDLFPDPMDLIKDLIEAFAEELKDHDLKKLASKRSVFPDGLRWIIEDEFAEKMGFKRKERLVNKIHRWLKAEVKNRALREGDWAKRTFKEGTWSYWITAIFFVNWEVVFQLPILGAMVVFGTGLAVGVPVLLIGAVLFAYAHPHRTARRVEALFIIGVFLGIPFLIPGLGLYAIPISMGMHSVYNFLVLMNWMPEKFSIASTGNRLQEAATGHRYPANTKRLHEASGEETDVMVAARNGRGRQQLGGLMDWVRELLIPGMSRNTYNRWAFAIENTIFMGFIGLPVFLLVLLATGGDVTVSLQMANVATWFAFWGGHSPTMIRAIHREIDHNLGFRRLAEARAPPNIQNFFVALLITMANIGVGLAPVFISRSVPSINGIFPPSLLALSVLSSFLTHFIVNALARRLFGRPHVRWNRLVDMYAFARDKDRGTMINATEIFGFLSNEEKTKMIEQIARVQARSFGRLTIEPEGRAPAEYIHDWQEAFQNSRAEVFVLLDDDHNVVGFLEAKIYVESAYIFRLGVSQEGRGQGSFLLSRYLTDLKRKGIPVVKWDASGHSPGFHHHLLAETLNVDYATEGREFTVYPKTMGKLTESQIKEQKAHLRLIKERKEEVDGFFAGNSGDQILKTKNYSLHFRVDSDGAWRYVSGAIAYEDLNDQSLRESILGDLIYDPGAELLDTDGSILLKKSGLPNKSSVTGQAESNPINGGGNNNLPRDESSNHNEAQRGEADNLATKIVASLTSTQKEPQEIAAAILDLNPARPLGIGEGRRSYRGQDPRDSIKSLATPLHEAIQNLIDEKNLDQQATRALLADLTYVLRFVLTRRELSESRASLDEFYAQAVKENDVVYSILDTRGEDSLTTQAAAIVNPFEKKTPKSSAQGPRVVLAVKGVPPGPEIVELQQRFKKQIGANRLQIVQVEDNFSMGDLITASLHSTENPEGIVQPGETPTLRFLLREGTLLPPNFMDLSALSAEVRRRFHVYIILNSIGGVVEIGRDLLPDWNKFRTRLIQA